MNWLSGTAVYFLIWWTVLFAVLPLGVQPDPEAQAQGGWRGAPRNVRILRIVALTTLISALLWVALDVLVRSDWLSFREGWLAKPNE